MFAELSAAALRELYAVPSPPAARPLVRANMITSVDGAATGADGVSGSLGTSADRRVFAILRRLADVVLVGAGTADTEGYGPLTSSTFAGGPRTLVLVSNHARVPSGVFAEGYRAGSVVLITHRSAPGGALAAARAALGEDQVWIIGDRRVDLAAAVARLSQLGNSVLCEGGPGLLGDLLAQGLIDELAVTTAPMLSGVGDGLRLHSAKTLDVQLTVKHSVAMGNTVFSLWTVGSPTDSAQTG